MSREKKTTVAKKQFDNEEDASFYAGEYLLREWRWGEKIDATGRATIVNIALKRTSLDVTLLQLETLAICLRKAPFTHQSEGVGKVYAPNYDALRNMPHWLGEHLSQILIGLNKSQGVFKARKKSLKKPTTPKEGQTTQPG